MSFRDLDNMKNSENKSHLYNSDTLDSDIEEVLMHYFNSKIITLNKCIYVSDNHILYKPVKHLYKPKKCYNYQEYMVQNLEEDSFFYKESSESHVTMKCPTKESLRNNYIHYTKLSFRDITDTSNMTLNENIPYPIINNDKQIELKPIARNNHSIVDANTALISLNPKGKDNNFNPKLNLKYYNCIFFLSGYSLNDKIIIITACKHYFHKRCILTWLIKYLNNSKCPVCNCSIDSL